MNKFGIIYMFRNKINSKVYIGKAVDVKRRYSSHLYYVKSGKGWTIHDAIRKYGIENFEFSSICSAISSEELSNLERDIISQYDSFENGYNETLGGDGVSGRTLSEEAKKRIGDANRGRVKSAETCEKHRQANLGKVLSEDHRLKLLAANMGTPRSEETKRKISEGNKGKKRSEAFKLLPKKPFTEEHKLNISKGGMGKVLSEDHKRKIGEGNLGKKLTEEHKLRISEGGKGRKMSEEHKQKMKEPKSEEHKKNLSISHMGKIPSRASVEKGLETRRLNRERKKLEAEASLPPIQLTPLFLV